MAEQLVVTGDTYAHKDTLKHFGFAWHKPTKSWRMLVLRSDIAANIQRLVLSLGLSITSKHVNTYARHQLRSLPTNLSKHFSEKTRKDRPNVQHP